MRIQPKGKDFWGPPCWTTIHILAISLRPEVAQEYEEFLWLLTRLLPCDYCKKNLTAKLKAYPPHKYLQTSEKAFIYTYIIHDLANQHITQHTKERKISPSFDHVREIYTNGMKHGPSFWGPPIWATIHIFAATLRQENGEYYQKFLELLSVLLPDKSSRDTLNFILNKYNIYPYLRNNHDAFLYTYRMHDIVNGMLKRNSPPYNNVKSFYFSSLGEECKDCKV